MSARLRYLSVCAGIEAATVAWHPMAFRPVAFSEIDEFACAVLRHHYPEVPNLGDLTVVDGERDVIARFGRPDIVVGGTPCQAFSVAGHRGGIEDPRGQITLHFLRLVAEVRPRWVVWENVPGVLSVDGRRTFGQVLSCLDKLGYGVCWRVLDAQFFGVPQARRRVFIVACLGGVRAAATVLFESEGVRKFAPAGPGERREFPRAFIVGPEGGREAEYTPTVDTKGFSSVTSGQGSVVVLERRDGYLLARRLTPLELERAQGFPDDYTLVEFRGRPASDARRYKAIGNSMAVPVMRWIGMGILAAEEAGLC